MWVILSDSRMVLLKTTLAGITLLVLGVLMLTVLGQYVPMEIQQVAKHEVEHEAVFLVGDLAHRSYSLPGGITVVGTVSATQAPSNQSTDIRFLVFDDENYQKWTSKAQPDALYSSDNPGLSNFTFSSRNSGVYHFVFDNQASLFKKYVTLSVAYNEVSISRVPDPRVGYLGWVLVVVGAMVLVYGLVRRAPIPWA